MDGTRHTDDDTSIDDKRQIVWLDSLTPEQRELAGIHHWDQLESTPSYIERIQRGKEGVAE